MSATITSATTTPYVPLTAAAAQTEDITAPAAPTTQTVKPAPQAAPDIPPLTDETLAALVTEQAAAAKPPIDLKGQDLRTLDLKTIDLRGADLSGANLSGMDLSGLDFTGATLTSADFSGSTLKGARLEGVSAAGANFSQATLDETSLDNANFVGADFQGATLGHLTPDEDGEHRAFMTSTNVTLDGANFSGATLQSIVFEGSSAKATDFSNAVAQSIGFRQSDLSHANFDNLSGRSVVFHDSDASDAAFTNSTATFVGFYSTTIEKTTFAGSSLNQTTFMATDLSAADLTGVVREARNAIFDQTNLDGLDLSGFDFSNAQFNAEPREDVEGWRQVAGAGWSAVGTNFSGASFASTRFNYVDLSNVASFAGAQVTDVLYRGGMPGELASMPGANAVSERGQAPWLGDDVLPNPLPPWLRTPDSVTQGSQGGMRGRATPGLEPPSVDDVALPAAGPSSVLHAPELKGADLALRTLKDVSDQLRARQDEAAVQRQPHPTTVSSLMRELRAEIE